MNERVRLHGDMREACLAEALAIIKDVGIEELSLREVARRLNVSHQAPYRHFPSRDHLLAEIVDRCFRDFDAYLAQAGETDDPYADLRRRSELYLEYAARFPLEYRLMFGAKLPRPEEHPNMLERGCGCFDQLRTTLARIFDTDPEDPRVMINAMLVWSSVHGLASILQTEAMGNLGVDEAVQASVKGHVLDGVEHALLANKARQ